MAAYVAPKDPTAVVGRRVVAYAIDALLAAAVVLALLWPALHSNLIDLPRTQYRCANTSEPAPVGTQGPRQTISESICIEHGSTLTYLPRSDQNQLTVRMYGGMLVIWLLNGGLLQGLTGASVGKLVLGLRTVRADGQYAGVWRCIVRSVVLLVDAWICCFIVGLVLALSTKGHRRLGDMAGGTWVVRRSSVGRPPTQPAGWPPGYGGYVAPGGYAGYGEPPYPGAAPGPYPGAPGGSAMPPWGTPTAASPSPSATPAEGPIWDEARNTYIQYDRARSQWVQWDDADQRWKQIDT